MKRIGFIGCGNMGGTLAAAAAKTELAVFVSDASEEKAAAFAREHGATPLSNRELAATCDVIFLGVKPQVLAAVLDGIKDTLESRTDRFLLVSMAAGVDLKTLASLSGGVYPTIRMMPNTPACVGEGMILYTPNASANEEDIALFLAAMKHAGLCDRIDEKFMDAASAVSGCGPAFVYMFIEALADGGVMCGLPRDKAIAYAAKTVLGAGKTVLETGRHPEELKDAVCSPAGSTIEGVRALENSAFRSACIEAISASYRRTKELGK